MMLNSKLALLTGIALGLVPTGIAYGQMLDTSIPAPAQQAAAQSLKTFQALSRPAGNSAKFGLNAPGEASQATLGVPMPDYVIDLTALKSWNGDDPKALLRSTGQVIYPITVKGDTRTSVTIAQVKGEWTAASFGSPNEAQARSQVRTTLSAKAPSGEAPTAQVRVPALNAVFVAQQVGDTLQFTPITSVPSLQLKAGETEPAKQVLLRIQPIAKELDPNVPH